MTRSSRHRSHRVLHPTGLTSLAAYEASGGGRALAKARASNPDDIIEIVYESGLRGRGGAGFPVGRKWTTVATAGREGGIPPSVVVNGAEGEPGTFKDRSIIRANPYLVVEGAAIAAHAVGATKVVIASKRSFAREVELLRRAIDEMAAAGMTDPDVAIRVFEGPDEYLYGEESALLEAVDGRRPFPRVTPTYRAGLMGDERDLLTAGPGLVNNVESIANIAKIVDRGAAWFRRLGTTASPGTTVCTVTGDTQRHGVGEVRLGTPLRRVLRVIGGGPHPGRKIKAVLSGVANPVIRGDQLSARVCYEGLAGIGSGLGSGGFIVFDDTADMVAVAAGVARFLSVESCGQCSPCKLDGIKLAMLLERLCRNDAGERDLAEIRRRATTVSYGARCYLGMQQETVITSILETFADEFDDHLNRRVEPVEPVFIAELIDIEDGVAVLDRAFAGKQPDWSFSASYSGGIPVDVHPRPPVTPSDVG